MRQMRRWDSNVGLAGESGRRSVAVIESGCGQGRTLSRPATLSLIQSQIQTSRAGPLKHRSGKASSGKEALNALKLVGNDFANVIEMSSERLVLFYCILGQLCSLPTAGMSLHLRTD